MESNAGFLSKPRVSQKAMILYRYLPEHAALATIESGTMKLGRFSDFNDPFEFLPAQSSQVGHQGMVSEFHLRTFREILDERKGILCFSHEDTIENPLLWSHYADHHRGIALGFEVLPTKTGEFLLQLGLADPAPRGVPVEAVEYVAAGDAKRVSIPEIDQLQSGADIRKVIDSYTRPLSLRKGRAWIYEMEWRAVVPLQAAEAKGGMNLLRFQKARLRKIVLGCRCRVTPNYISRLLNEPIGNTMIERAVPHQYEFRLRIDPDP